MSQPVAGEEWVDSEEQLGRALNRIKELEAQLAEARERHMKARELLERPPFNEPSAETRQWFIQCDDLLQAIAGDNAAADGGNK